MELLTNKQFGNINMDIYSKDGEFYMSRAQINTALEYSDDKSMARIISRHKDVIKEGTMIKVSANRGTGVAIIDLEVFEFNQIFQILRFSKAEKANLFMEFTALTMKQLLMGKAELVFEKDEDRIDYTQQVINLMRECKSYGIPKYRAAILLKEAKLNDNDPDIVILEELRLREKNDLERRRSRIRERVMFMSNYVELQEGDENQFEAAWHALSNSMRYEIGVDMAAIRRRQKKSGKEPTSYLDLIAKYEAYPEAEKAINKILKVNGVN